jgi:hypothetical protein
MKQEKSRKLSITLRIKRICHTYFTFIVFLFSIESGLAQSYIYDLAESFESEVWDSASSSSNAIVSSTGEWTVAKNNVRNASYAQDGVYSLLLATKTHALISPRLDNGAGFLTFHMIKPSGGGRTITIYTSTDKVTWTDWVVAEAVPSEWTEKRVVINDPAVRYISFTTNSNGGVYIDNVKITSAGSQDISVHTYFPENVSQTSATVGGLIETDDAKLILSRGVCYGTNEWIDISFEKVEATGSTGEFSVNLTHLNPGTTYYAKAYAVTSLGVNYGDAVSFTTRPADPPLLYFLQDFNNSNHLPSSEPTTPESIEVPGQGTWIFQGASKSTNSSYIQDGSPSNLRIRKNGAYVITPTLDDGVTYVSFYEGRGDRELTIYKSTDNGENWIRLEVVKTKKVLPNIVYVNSAEVNRIKITNESGNDADIDNLSVSIYPTGTLPAVITSNVTNIGKNHALAGGEVTANGSKSVVERGICWNTEGLPILADNIVNETGGLGSFSMEINNLPAGKTIYLRAYATSRSGTAYGNVVTFTTDPATIPVVETITATNITAETATTGGHIIDSGGAPITMKGVCWSTNNNPAIENDKTRENSNDDNYVSILRNLLPNTQYYYRAYTVNEAGTGYGDVKTFTTRNLSMPSVITSDISDILSYKALGGGTIADTGNAPVTCGLCWNTTGNPTTADVHTVIESDETIFTSTIGKLKGSTTYFVRAYVTNSAGTSYGEEKSFTTLAPLVLYVSPEGNDAIADGSFENPFYSVQKAVDLVQAGDFIYMKGGTYNYSKRINIGTIGATDGGTIYLGTLNGERALLDFSSMSVDPNNQGIRLTGSYWYIYGLDIKGAGDNGLLIERNKPTGGTPDDIKNKTEEGHHNTIEFCSFYDNKDTGLQMKNMAEYNQVINCDSYFNRDLEDGNADGFAPKLSVGTGNYFYGCRAWNNSDDGWDGILYDSDEGFEDDMTTIYENCWAFNNGFLKDGSEGKGNGNGFKLGGSSNMDRRHNVILIRCLAFDNLMKGFDQNHNTGDMFLLNCTGFSNKYLKNKNHFTYKIDEDILAPGKELTLVNCVAVWDGITDPDKSQYTPLRLMEGNRYTCDFLTSASDYVSTDTTGATGARKTDGNLPELPFMHVASGNTKLIDTGTIIGHFNFNGIAIQDPSFNGTLPDLGCFETNGTGSSINEVQDPQKQISRLIIYPQPATDRFTVNIPDALSQTRFKLYLFNPDGTQAFQTVFSGVNAIINRDNLSSGIYLAVVIDEGSGRKYSAKLVLK